MDCGRLKSSWVVRTAAPKPLIFCLYPEAVSSIVPLHVEVMFPALPPLSVGAVNADS